MYFAKINLRHEADVLVRAARTMTQGGYRMHQALWQLFASEEHSPRDFLYRRVETSSWPCFYVVSARQPVDTRGLWTVQVKDYTPKLRAGQRLAFTLCANPVVTKPGPSGKPVRHDVMMNAKQQLRGQGGATIYPGELIQQTGHAWLATRAPKYGFDLEKLRVDGYRQHQFRKARGGPMIRLSTVDFNGVLTVLEPDAFRRALFAGIGPAKGFGCGLLLIRHV